MSSIGVESAIQDRYHAFKLSIETSPAPSLELGCYAR